MNETSLLEFLGAEVTRCAAPEDIPPGADCYTVLADGSFLAVSGTEDLLCRDCFWRGEEQPVYLAPEVLLPWLEVKVAWDQGMDQYSSCVRRPGYQLRGRPVAPEQAFEIIRRTDNFFGWECGAGPDYLGSINFDSWWFHGNHYPAGYGWCHPDGFIGLDSITQKYPHAGEFVMEWGRLLMAFPFLDVSIVIWRVDEGIGSREESVECGIHIHDGKIELLSPKHALEVFREYDGKWGGDPTRFDSDYNQEHHRIVCGEEYLKRCIAANGLDPEKTLAAVPDYVKHLFFHDRR